MLKKVLVILFVLILSSVVYADNKTVLFTSSYTYLSQECKWAYTEKELSEGQDNALICKGYDKYQIFIYFSAMNSHLSVRLKTAPDKVIFDPAISGIDEKGGVVEWRMADRIPFAIIMRSKEYSGEGKDRNLVKDSLVVRGLGQYSSISGIVPVDSKMEANEKARKLADDALMTIINSNR